MKIKKRVYLLYSHAVGVFLHRVLHITELWLQALDALLELQPSLLAALQLRHFLIQLALHTVELGENTHTKKMIMSCAVITCCGDGSMFTQLVRTTRLSCSWLV